jgi:hypothetical protein
LKVIKNKPNINTNNNNNNINNTNNTGNRGEHAIGYGNLRARAIHNYNSSGNSTIIYGNHSNNTSLSTTPLANSINNKTLILPQQTQQSHNTIINNNNRSLTNPINISQQNNNIINTNQLPISMPNFQFPPQFINNQQSYPYPYILQHQRTASLSHSNNNKQLNNTLIYVNNNNKLPLAKSTST